MERDRFYLIAGILFLIFLIFMGVVIWKADALTHNACQICAAKMGESITCTTPSGMGFATRTFFPNYNISDGVA